MLRFYHRHVFSTTECEFKSRVHPSGLRSPPQTMPHKPSKTTSKEVAAAVWNQAELGLQRGVCYLETNTLSWTKREVVIPIKKLSLALWLKWGVYLYTPPAHTEHSPVCCWCPCVSPDSFILLNQICPSFCPTSFSRGASHFPLPLLLSVWIAVQEDMHTGASSVLWHWATQSVSSTIKLVVYVDYISIKPERWLNKVTKKFWGLENL